MKINKKDLVAIIEEELAAIVKEENHKELEEAGMRQRLKRALTGKDEEEWERISKGMPGSAGAEIGPGPQRGVQGHRVGSAGAEVGQRGDINPVSGPFKRSLEGALGNEFNRELGSQAVSQLLKNIIGVVGRSAAFGQLEEASPYSLRMPGTGQAGSSVLPRGSREPEPTPGEEEAITITAAEILKGVQIPAGMNPRQLINRIASLLNQDVQSKFSFNVDLADLPAATAAAAVDSPTSNTVDPTKLPDIVRLNKLLERVKAPEWIKEKTNLLPEMIALLEMIVNLVEMDPAKEIRAVRGLLQSMQKSLQTTSDVPKAAALDRKLAGQQLGRVRAPGTSAKQRGRRDQGPAVLPAGPAMAQA